MVAYSGSLMSDMVRAPPALAIVVTSKVACFLPHFHLTLINQHVCHQSPLYSDIRVRRLEPGNGCRSRSSDAA